MWVLVHFETIRSEDRQLIAPVRQGGDTSEVVKLSAEGAPLLSALRALAQQGYAPRTHGRGYSLTVLRT